jgi:hypothetical protein
LAVGKEKTQLLNSSTSPLVLGQLAKKKKTETFSLLHFSTPPLLNFKTINNERII